MNIFTILITLLFLTKTSPVFAASNLKYFGYYNYDYPGATPTKNLDELKSLGNINIAFSDLWGTDTPGIAAFSGTSIKALVPVEKIFFEKGITGKPNKLISGWPTRLQELKTSLAPFLDSVYGFYMSDEPNWNDISKADFITASKAISEAFPGKAIMAVEAYPPIESGSIPSDYYQYITDIGFDYYFTLLDQSNDTGWNKFVSLYNKFAIHTQNKKVWLIPDGYALTAASALRLPDALDRYYNFALTKQNIVGMLVYSYGTGYQYESQHYLMPQFSLYNSAIRARHIEIGKSIVTNDTQPMKLPIGNFDSATCEYISGWTCDPTDFNQTLGVYMYHGGPTNQGGVHFATPIANISRETAVSVLCGGKPGHGFSASVPSTLKDGKVHSIYVYAKGLNTSQINPLLHGSPKNITCSTTISTHSPSPPASLPGDCNNDNKIDIFDYTILISNFNRTGANGFISSDINKDGTVNIFDYNIVVTNFGK